MKAPIESKVIAGAAGAAGGGVAGTFVLWLLGAYLFGGSTSAEAVPATLAAVPTPVSAVVVALVALVGSYVAGYLAKHTPRPDLEQSAALTSGLQALRDGRALVVDPDEPRHRG